MRPTIVTESAPSGGWWSLLTVERLSRDPVYRQPRVLSCPNDGEPLRTGPDGQLYCTFDGYRPGVADPEYGLVTA